MLNQPSHSGAPIKALLKPWASPASIPCSKYRPLSLQALGTSTFSYCWLDLDRLFPPSLRATPYSELKAQLQHVLYKTFLTSPYLSLDSSSLPAHSHELGHPPGVGPGSDHLSAQHPAQDLAQSQPLLWDQH